MMSHLRTVWKFHHRHIHVVYLQEQAVRVATRYAPAPLLPVGTQAPRAPLSRRNVAVISHAQYVLTITAALRPR